MHKRSPKLSRQENNIVNELSAGGKIMKRNKKELQRIIAACIVAILGVVAIPGCSTISLLICIITACIMAHNMQQLDNINAKNNTNQ